MVGKSKSCAKTNDYLLITSLANLNSSARCSRTRLGKSSVMSMLVPRRSLDFLRIASLSWWKITISQKPEGSQKEAKRRPSDLFSSQWHWLVQAAPASIIMQSNFEQYKKVAELWPQHWLFHLQQTPTEREKRIVYNKFRDFNFTWNFSKQTVTGRVPLTLDPSALLAFKIDIYSKSKQFDLRNYKILVFF